MKQRCLERAKSKLSVSGFEDFEQSWRTMEKLGLFAVTVIPSSQDDPSKYCSACDFALLFGPRLENAVTVRPIYPYWNSCLAIASLWLGLGILAFGIDRWRRYRAYRTANETSLNLSKC